MEVRTFFCAVLLPECNYKIVVRNSWVNIPITEAITNVGLKPHSTCTVFYSPDKQKNSDFTLNVSDQFDETRDGCYKANVLRSFRKYSVHPYPSELLRNKMFWIEFSKL